MRRTAFQIGIASSVIIAAVLVAAPAFAGKPAWVGGGKGNKHESKNPHESHGQTDSHRGGSPRHGSGGPPQRGYFDDRQKAFVHDYYAEQFRAGRCPPGLAKKRNGCLPPGQAKKWAYDRPLPADVVYYDLPSAIVQQLGMPPQGYRYVRVANDILLISAGTRMVVDAIMDLGRGR
jgi:hypothetical protein